MEFYDLLYDKFGSVTAKGIAVKGVGVKIFISETCGEMILALLQFLCRSVRLTQLLNIPNSLLLSKCINH